jgi:hypothetical protein
MFDMSPEFQEHYEMLVKQGSIIIRDGEHYQYGVGDPYAEHPKTSTQVIEFVAFNKAACMYYRGTADVE